MNDCTHLPPLPCPTRTRWEPLRLGLVELYHYDVEEFWFRDGHLLLRGNNGTGKSKVLSLTLPFLLDGSMSAARVEPDGDRSKRMEWNLLMNKRHERRVGYSWIEFGRRDEGGQVQTLTLGCGMRAVAGRPHVDSWFFVTTQRVGADLWLTTKERTVLPRERLIEAIGSAGQVFDTAQAYRRAIDERLFRLGTERYAALVDTLIQLRQPQLSKNPDEERLSDALTNSLRPLDRAALEDVGEALSELEEIRRGLEEINAMRTAVAAFGARYRRYAQIATRRRARSLRQAQTEFDNASREVNLAKTELDEALAAVEGQKAAVASLEDHLAGDEARLGVLRADPVMRDAVRIDDAREVARLCASAAAEAASAMAACESTLSRETSGLAIRQERADQSRARLVTAATSAKNLADETGLAEAHAGAVKPLALPVLGRERIDVEVDDPAGMLDAAADAQQAHRRDAIDAFLSAIRTAELRRREHVAVVRQRTRELAAAEGAEARERDARQVRAEAHDAAHESARHAGEALRDTSARLLADWERHAAAVRILRLPEFEAHLADFENWLESLEGANPLRLAMDEARRRHESHSASRRSALEVEGQAVAAAQTDLLEERTRLEAGETQMPPAPHTRDPNARAGRAGAPLWQLVDFAPGVDDAARAGLEAALEASGVLDAWITPEGTVLDSRTHDVLLVPRAPRAGALTSWIVPTIPATELAAAVDSRAVSAVLDSIACGDVESPDSEFWVSPRGEFRLGVARGCWSKPVAQYIGHAAREAARQARLQEIATQLAAIDAQLAENAAAAARLQEEQDTARREYDSAPTDDELLRAWAQRNSAEHQRRAAQTALGEADSRLAQARMALEGAREALERDARDLNLPPLIEGIENIERALNDYRLAVMELAGAAREHRSSLAELSQQRLRAETARQTLEDASANQREKQRLLRAAEETLHALLGSVGKQVSELLSQIEAAASAGREHDRMLKDARARLILASSERGTAQQKHSDSNTRLEERIEARRQAVVAWQAFATETGFVAMILPDVEAPGPDVPWGVDAALTLARRAEQALADVAADDPQWERIQRDIGPDFTALQSAMSAQGQSATVEPSEHGLIVRIVYRQRPERPDSLERRLEAELQEQRLILSAQERAVLEQHLEKEIAANLQRMIRETEERVQSINDELDKRPTSTGVRYRLRWHPLSEDSEHGIAGLVEARKRLLKTSADAWSTEERRQVGEFLHARIEAERQEGDDVSLTENLAKALDYRRWHRFEVERKQDGEWKSLSGPASSGERALGLTVPLFAAASSHYESADPRAPRLVLLDEAFAGIDDEARASCMGLIREFDLDFVMTSEREWGCYPELPGLAICQLVRREGMDAVLVSRWSWDGRVRRAEQDHARRFPQAEAAEI